jgi:hypothetical protein
MASSEVEERVWKESDRTWRDFAAEEDGITFRVSVDETSARFGEDLLFEFNGFDGGSYTLAQAQAAEQAIQAAVAHARYLLPRLRG